MTEESSRQESQALPKNPPGVPGPRIKRPPSGPRGSSAAGERASRAWYMYRGPRGGTRRGHSQPKQPGTPAEMGAYTGTSPNYSTIIIIMHARTGARARVLEVIWKLDNFEFLVF